MIVKQVGPSCPGKTSGSSVPLRVRSSADWNNDGSSSGTLSFDLVEASRNGSATA